MSFISPKVLKAMRELDSQIDSRATRSVTNREKYKNPQVEKGIAEGVNIAREVDQKVRELARAYENFLERHLRVIVDTLGCAPEDLELVSYPLEKDPDRDGFFTSTQMLKYKGVDLVKYRRYQEADGEFIFLAEPVLDE